MCKVRNEKNRQRREEERRGGEGRGREVLQRLTLTLGEEWGEEGLTTDIFEFSGRQRAEELRQVQRKPAVQDMECSRRS